MNRQFVTVFLILIFTYFSSNAQGQAETRDEKPSFRITKIDQPLKINGKVDNPLWNNAEPFELTYEISPGDNTPAKLKTFVRALYDSENIYFAFQCLDPNPEEIRANMTDRDRMFADDFVLIVLDPYGENQRAYEFAVNPFGIKGDLLATLNGEDSSVDIIWDAAAEKNDKGWTAEFAIPFSSLRFSESENSTWAVNFFRTIQRESRIQNCWTKIERGTQNFLSKSGMMTGLNGIESGGSVEILPYIIGQKNGAIADFDDPASKFSYGDITGRFGGGIKYSPSPDLTIDAVLNPDFSQIESDAAQISVNTTFALYYREKRPFFLRGRDMLQTPMYYSRSINNPLAASRISGKSGKLSYQYLGAYDRNTVIVVPGEEQSNTVATDLKSMVNVGKLRYDFGNDNYLGTLVMSRNMTDGHNYLFGFDWNYKFMDGWYFNGEVFLSNTKELNDTSLIDENREFGTTGHDAEFNGENYSGTGLHLVLSHEQRSYNFDLVFNNFSPTYQTYNGLFSRVGNRQLYMRHEYVFYPEDSFIDRGEIGVNSNLEFNFDGEKKEQVITPYFYLGMKGQTHFNISYLLVNDEKFFGTQFDKINRANFYISTRPIKELSLSVDGSVGKFIYRSDEPEMGEGHNFGAYLNFKPTPRLSIEFSYNRARLSSVETDELFYDGNIYRAVGIYQFNAEMFFRTILQYNSFNDSFQVYPLFSYKLNAFTTFYAGATSNYTDYRENHGIVNTDQQYFLKLQYLFGI